MTDGWGGAVLAWDGAPVTIERSDISGNLARVGGGIYNFANSVLMLPYLDNRTPRACR